MTKQLKVRKNKANNATATEIALMVTSGTDQTIEQFDSDVIVKSLQEELSLSSEIAKSISMEVTDKLVAFSESSKITSVTSSLIRDFINVILYEKGNKLSLKSDNSITIPTYDIVKLIEMSNKENGNLTHCPESINFVLAERIMKDYAFKRVYNKDSVRAHLEGKIYIHDAGAPCRAYCSGHSIEYLKLNGIRGIENIMSTSAPANSAWTLARHLCSITQFYSGIFAGAIGWDAVNIFFAPMLKGWSQKKMKQLAQTLIFDLSQLAGAKGGQTSFTDFNIYLTVPNIYRNTIAVGNGGKFLAIDMTGNEKLYDTREALLEDEKHGHITGLRYKDFEKEAQGFARAIFSVIEEGDAAGLPFAFPKINMHINEDTFTTLVFVEGKGFVAAKNGVSIFYKTLDDMSKAIDLDFEIVPERTPNHDGHKLLMAACKAASHSGCPYFIFDRGGASISQCCRLTVNLDDAAVKRASYAPETLRFVGVQNVTINLPNCAIESDHNMDKFYKELTHRMDLAVKAHFDRTKYLEKLMSLENTPLSFYKRGMDGKPYVDLRSGSYLIGIVGLNECVYDLIGQQLHESDEAYLLGLKIVSFMLKYTKVKSEETKLTLKLEETPAESCSTRLATMDKKKYGDKAFVKQNSFGIYYSNSVHFAYDCNMDYMERLTKQSRFHTLVEAGSMIHNWVGDKLPEAKAIYNLVEYTYRKTECTQFTISPEFTKCSDCCETVVGLRELCPKCGGNNVVHLERVTGYYAVVEKFNHGKRAEHADRNKAAYIIK